PSVVAGKPVEVVALGPSLSGAVYLPGTVQRGHRDLVRGDAHHRPVPLVPQEDLVVPAAREVEEGQVEARDLAQQGAGDVAERPGEKPVERQQNKNINKKK